MAWEGLLTVIAMSAQRIQRRRTKGWRMPEGAIYVGRPTRWGNPFKVGERVDRESPIFPFLAQFVPGGARGLSSIACHDPDVVVTAYFDLIINNPPFWLSIPDLAGHDLACWCPLNQPCHADVLLEVANGSTP